MKKINKLNCYEARDIGHQLNEQQNPLTGFNNSWPIFWTYIHIYANKNTQADRKLFMILPNFQHAKSQFFSEEKMSGYCAGKLQRKSFDAPVVS